MKAGFPKAGSMRRLVVYSSSVASMYGHAGINERGGHAVQGNVHGLELPEVLTKQSIMIRSNIALHKNKQIP